MTYETNRKKTVLVFQSRSAGLTEESKENLVSRALGASRKIPRRKIDRVGVFSLFIWHRAGCAALFRFPGPLSAEIGGDSLHHALDKLLLVFGVV